MVLGEQNLKEYVINNSSREFMDIEDDFNRGSNKYSIHGQIPGKVKLAKITRIQNHLLWVKYVNERRSLRSKLGYDS